MNVFPLGMCDESLGKILNSRHQRYIRALCSEFNFRLY